MTEEELKSQVFKTADQWNSGLSYRLQMSEDGGITLYAFPTFTKWFREAGEMTNAGPLFIDECGQVYFINNDNHRLYRYNPDTRFIEEILGAFEHVARILADKYTLWAFDKGNKNILAFSRDHFQVKHVIRGFNDPVDFGVDARGHVYVLDRTDTGTFRIFAHDNHGRPVESHFDTSCLASPVCMAAGKENKLYVIDKDHNGFFTLTGAGECMGPLNTFDRGFHPSIMTVDTKGIIYAANADDGEIRQFDPDGSYTGTLSIPGFTGTIHGLACDSGGDLYAGTDRGIAFFSKEKTVSKETGVYYSKTLDSGIENCVWHRLALNVDLPPRTLLEVYYYTSDDNDKKEKIDACLSDEKKSALQKKIYVENVIPWQEQEPETNPQDMLFREKTGQYLWLKIELSTFEDTLKPAVSGMRVYYPRISYLRYLPAIYQEDPVSKEFLERFLSIFESRFHDREVQINTLSRYFDPQTTPGNFLEWLASWLNLALEEEWEEEKKKQLIEEAYGIYKQKGTPGGLSRFIAIYTGEAPFILEHAGESKPMVLNKKFRLGIDSILTRGPVRGFRLGMGSIIGRAALRETAVSPEDPFLPTAHRFTVVLNLTAPDYRRFETGVRRILDEEKPAHTVYTLRNIGDMDRQGNQYVGINTYVSGYRPLRLGEDSVLGTGLVVFDNSENAGKVERRSRVSIDTLLI